MVDTTSAWVTAALRARPLARGCPATRASSGYLGRLSGWVDRHSGPRKRRRRRRSRTEARQQALSVGGFGQRRSGDQSGLRSLIFGDVGDHREISRYGEADLRAAAWTSVRDLSLSSTCVRGSYLPLGVNSLAQ
jgi:hypothetical protein